MNERGGNLQWDTEQKNISYKTELLVGQHAQFAHACKRNKIVANVTLYKRTHQI